MVIDFTVLLEIPRYGFINAKFFMKSDLTGSSKVREVISEEESQIVIVPIVEYRSDTLLSQNLS